MKKFVLVCLLAGLPTAAFAGPNTCEWFGLNTWSFANGLTSVTYNCNNVNYSGQSAALVQAEAACQQAWNSFGSNYSATGTFDVQLYAVPLPGVPNTLQWAYSCRTCIDGYPPAFADVKPRPVSLEDAIGGAVGEVPGDVMATTYHPQTTDEGPYYSIEILGKHSLVEVQVDGKTGRVRVPSTEEPAVCRAP